MSTSFAYSLPINDLSSPSTGALDSVHSYMLDFRPPVDEEVGFVPIVPVVATVVSVEWRTSIAFPMGA